MFNEIYDTLFSSILEFRSDQLVKLESEKGFSPEKTFNNDVSINLKSANSLNFLGPKIINDFVGFKEKVGKKIASSSNNFEDIYQDKRIIIERSCLSPDFYRMESVF